MYSTNPTGQRSNSRNGGRVSAVVKKSTKKKQSTLVGTGNFGGNTGHSQSRMNRSMLSNKSDTVAQTPLSKHSRKSSQVSFNHNSSQKIGGLLKSKQRKCINSVDRNDSISKAEQCTF